MVGSSSVSLSSCKMSGASPASQSPADASIEVTHAVTPEVDATQATHQATRDPAPECEQKKKGKVRSKVWNDFVRHSEEQAQCKYCKTKLQEHIRGNGTSTMKTHLGIYHENPNKKLKG
ncbi:hypothetical protein MKX03_010411 [Papaver bracteatum]|nr:hypothetical protein MKX03_010411 [Papaver bracteatum]